MRQFFIFILFSLPLPMVGQAVSDTKDNELLALISQADTLSQHGEYEQAIDFYSRFLQVSESSSDLLKSPINMTYVLAQMGDCYRQLRLYDLSATCLLQADSIYNCFTMIVDGIRCHVDRLLSLTYLQSGQYDKAEQWSRKSLMHHRRFYKSESMQTANAYYRLYRVYAAKGDDAQASVNLEQYLNTCIRINRFDENDLSDIRVIVRLGELYYKLNKCDESIALLVTADTLLAQYHTYHPLHLQTKNTLFTIAASIGDSEAADKYINEAVELSEKMDDNEEASDPMMALYSNLAVYLQDAYPEQCIAICQDIIDYYQSEGKTSTLNYAIALSNLAHVKGFDNEESLSLMRIASDVLAGLNDVDVTILLSHYISYIIALDSYGKKYEAEITTRVAFVEDYLGMKLRDSFSFLSEAERTLYWNQVRGWYQHVLPLLAHERPTPDNLRLCYNGLLQSRGILLSSSVSIEQLVHSSHDPVLKSIYSQMASQKGNDDDYALSARLEKRILEQLPQYGRFMDKFDVTVDSVRRHLLPGDVAIEFMKADISNTVEDTLMYMVLVMKHDYDAPHLIQLCTEESLAADSDGDLYYKKVWQPLATELNDVKRIFFSPDGVLFSLPIEYALLSSGQCMMDVYQCCRLSSTRELTYNRITTGCGAVFYGGIRYDMTIDEMVKDADNYRAVTAESVHERGDRSALIGISPLPATLTEVQQIAHVVEGAPSLDGNVRLLTGKEATEASFKHLASEQKRIIHIATHGFYDATVRDSILVTDESNLITAEETALSKSGLLFAGVDNVRFNEPIPPGVEDGVMTAAEIARMDLNGSDMIVLSACQTGLGEITGDGVFGLQRGFKKAGANSILMSLWKVDDEATCLLMTEFYRNWISQKMTKHDALEKAKQTVRSHKEKGWDDPKYWAAFILLDGLD